MFTNQFELPTFEFEAGEDREFQVTLKSQGGNVLDPTGSSATCLITDYVTPGTTWVTKTCTVVGDDTPVLSFQLARDDTLLFPSGKYLYQLTVNSNAGTDVFRGVLLIHRNLESFEKGGD